MRLAKAWAHRRNHFLAIFLANGSQWRSPEEMLEEGEKTYERPLYLAELQEDPALRENVLARIIQIVDVFAKRARTRGSASSCA